MNIEEQIQRKRELQDLTKELDNYLETLVSKRLKCVEAIEELTETHIRPVKDEMSQIDCEIERILKQTGSESVVTPKYGAYLKEEFTFRVTDQEKALDWARDHPHALKKDILKRSELSQLVKEGVVPNAEENGIDCNDTFQKLSFRRR